MALRRLLIMPQFNKFRGARGWLSLWEKEVRLRYMNNLPKTEHRLRILRFWDTYGLSATINAYGVSRRTFYQWKVVLLSSGGYNRPTA
jgi:hypothetical protein